MITRCITRSVVGPGRYHPAMISDQELALVPADGAAAGTGWEAVARNAVTTAGPVTR